MDAMLVVEFISIQTFNAASVVLDEWMKVQHSRSYVGLSAAKCSAAMAS